MAQANDAALEVDVVSPEGPIWSGTASAVSLPGLEGDLGILPGRQPILAILRSGTIRITNGKADNETAVADVELKVPQGFVVVDNNQVTACVSQDDEEQIASAVSAD